MVLIISILFLSTASARFMYQEIDPVCSASWETYTTSFAWMSDTSTWEMPTAYKWECKKTPELTDETKQKIYDSLMSYFKEKNYLGNVYNNNSVIVDDNSEVLNPIWQKFVNEKYFPMLIDRINSEYEKSEPNLKKIAFYHFSAKTIWYDYYVNIK